ncbi:Altered inheritance of mitochondria protein 24, mitochondrial [Xanthoria calcicola]
MRHSHTLRILADVFKCPKGAHPGAQWQWQQRRQIHISAPSASTNEPLLTEPIQSSDNISPDAKFEISDSPLPLLHVSLSASQNLHTRRGTLVGLGGKPDNVVSTLSILEPFRRLIGGIPFLYQRISSTSPITALISPKPSISSLAVVHLDGSTDWMVVGRSLLAWTGQTLSVRPTISPKLVRSRGPTSKPRG